MNWLFFSIATALLWGTAELFYKKGAQPDEKYSHLKISVWVGVVMGAHAIYTLLTQDIGYNPANLLIYLPVSLFYIFSMTFSYFGMRFLEESISDPIENTAGVICVLLFAIFMGDEFSALTWIAVAVITLGVVGVSYIENRGETPRKKLLGKKLAIVAFCMPFVYALLDAFGTFLDDAFFLVEDIANAPFVDVTEETIEAVANPSYELPFALFALFMGDEFSWLTWLSVGVITVGVVGVSYLENHGETTRKKNYGKALAIISFCMPFVYALLDAFGTFLDDAFFLIEDVASSPLVDVTEETIEAVANTSYELTFALFALCLFIFMKSKKVKFGSVPQHKDKILAAVFETAGQFTYVYALGGVDAVAAPILSSVCVVSLLLSRIFLKEKLSWKTYAFIAVVIVGILLLAVSEEL